MAKDGAKSGKASRSSKTARVLSLLTDPEATGEEAVAENATDRETYAAKQQEIQRANDEATERQIHDALVSELGGLVPEPASAAQAEPEPELSRQPVIPAVEAAGPAPFVPELFDQDGNDEPAVEAAGAALFVPEVFDQDGNDEPVGTPEQEPEPEPEPESKLESAPEPAPQSAPAAETAPAPVKVTFQTSAATPDRDNDEEYTVLNVTQALVEEKAEKYINMLGLCNCNRCHIDVIALALSDLPAKYVVVKGKDINPRLSFYESKYSSAVITAVMSACKKVNDKPHHER